MIKCCINCNKDFILPDNNRSSIRQFCSKKCSSGYRTQLNNEEYLIYAHFRFIQNVNIDTPNMKDCWEWIGSTLKGYGTLWYRNKATLAARYSYIAHYGVSLNSKMLVCHTCDNPICVNPAHLFLGFSKDNTQDCIQKGRFHPGRRFTKYEIKLIRKEFKAGKTIQELAFKNNSAINTIVNVTSYKSYKYIK